MPFNKILLNINANKSLHNNVSRLKSSDKTEHQRRTIIQITSIFKNQNTH